MKLAVRSFLQVNVTCVEEVPAGSEVFYRKGDEILSVPMDYDSEMIDLTGGNE